MILPSRLEANVFAEGTMPVPVTNALANLLSVFQFCANAEESVKKINPLMLKKLKKMMRAVMTVNMNKIQGLSLDH